MSYELMPCPMCGGMAVLDGRSDDVRVRCMDCGTTGPVRHWGEHDDEDALDAAMDAAEIDAIAAWNRRAQVREAVAQEREACALIAQTPAAGEQDDITMSAKDRIAAAIRARGKGER